MLNYGAALDPRDIHNGNFLRPNDTSGIARIITDFIGDATIEEVNAARGKKFACVAADLVSSGQAVLTSGNAAAAVAASSRILLQEEICYIGDFA